MNNKKTKDHLGNEFISLKEMCKHYDLERITYYKRKNRGWSLEKILTTKIRTDKVSYDHLGNKFDSERKMCEYYNIRLGIYQHRINTGWPLKYALTIPAHFTLADAFKLIEELEARINQIDVHRTDRE